MILRNWSPLKSSLKISWNFKEYEQLTMPELQLFRLEKSDLPQLTFLWNKNVEYDVMTEKIFYEKTFGDSDFLPDLTLVARVGQEIAGFMQGLHRTNHLGEKIGWIKLFFTVKAFRRRGVATALLHEIENGLKSAGVQRLQIMDCNPNYFQPGIDPFYTEAVCFAERNGYKKFADTANLLADLSQDLDTDSQEGTLLQEGIEIRRAVEKDRDEVLNFIGQFWPPWVQEVETAFGNDPISLHLAFLHGQPRAFSAYDVNNKGMGWFGPMGTDPVFRGKGVGGILLKRCLRDIRDQGHKYSIIPWVGPIPFYMHYVDAHVHRVFWRYKKEFE